ncbi:VCBS repeat-containing protein [bacterium]|nr:VCBS repeat-containing protein [bacterium]
MKKVILTVVFILLLTSLSAAQHYTEIFEGGWGQGRIAVKPSIIDLDHDGRLDLFVGQEEGTISHYEQETEGSSQFTFVTREFNDIDVGTYSSPCFTDLTGNGLYDLIIGKNDGHLVHYEQDAVGSTTFVLITDDFNEIDAGGWSVPTFVDLDNDDLLDLIIGNQNGYLQHYEQNTTGSTTFQWVSDSLSGIDVGGHATPSFTDLDDDDLLDLVIGEDSGKLSHYEQDAVGSTHFVMVTENLSDIDVYYYSAPHLVDLDGDGLLDMIVGNFWGLVSHYEQGATGSEDFDLISDQMLDIIGVGSHSAPSLTDLDGDDLLDLIVGNLNGYLSHYEQDAENSIYFTLMADSLSGIVFGNYATPCFTDLDGDGLADLIIGQANGTLAHYEQDAEGSISFVLVSESFNGIDIGDDSAPCFTDLDSDGLLDLVIGEEDGKLNHYEQDGEGSFNFSLISENLGGIDVCEWSGPCFTDLDDDGLLDLIVGIHSGYLNHYEQNAPGSSDFTRIEYYFNDVDVSVLPKPVFGDINGDGLEDFLVGDGYGGIYYFQRDEDTGIEEMLINPFSFRILQNYPNPFNPVTTIQYECPRSMNVHISVYNMVGQRLKVLVNGFQRAGMHSVQWMGDDDQGNLLASGIYICRMEAGEFRHSIELMLLK